MTYEPLHHKYRPQTFADLVGQSAIATTLSNALISERIAPAYLFTGPRGTGKTSSARILAKSLNCLSSDHPTPIPCGKCSVCQAIANGSALDVIEIDAASNTGVDNIREIIERSQFAPVQCRYKVYVIDECLTGDSLVFTETGLIPINHPEILGKRVLSYNESSGEWEYKKVLRWLNRGVKATLTIQTRNRTINCTGNHLIRTEKAWIQAKNLKIGDQILSPVNVAAVQYRPSIIKSPQWLTNFEEVIGIQEGDTESVYDLEVEDNHNFVANGLLVHNCHMLSTAAFNALLKTLEEPPDRVIFVLATTDPQRVLPTIISRCQRFDYRRIALDAMVAHLQKIAQIEAIDINLEALTLVAQIANGGLRDAESLLDQLSLLAGTITAERVWDLVGAVPERDLLTLLKVIHSNIPDQVIEQCRHLMNRGKEPLIVLQNLAGFYLNLLLAKTAPNRPEMVAVTAPTWQDLCTEARTWSLEEILRGQQLLKDSETQLKNTTQPRLWLEVTLLGLLPQAQVIPLVATVAPSRPQTSAERPPEVITAPAPVNQPIKPAVITPITSVAVPKTEVKTVASDDNHEQIWQQVLEVMEPPTTRTLLRQHGSLFSMEESSAYLSISSEQLLKMARLRLTNIESAFEAVFQRRIKVHLQVGSATAAMAAEVSQSPAARIQPPPETAPTPPITPENKVMTVVDIPPVKEAIIEKKEAKITASGTPKTPSTELPQKILSFDSSLETLDQDVDVSEILAAAQKLAKSFDGEVVNMGYSLPENSDAETKVNKSLENMTIVRGRPDVNEILESLEEDEDLPF
ncbi:MAG: DNA polymerase III subunit gamma/tau [Microcystis sp. M114S2]|jgi:DNA polymerase-3 subunit gamma/tau|uniref:DNA polymerase III subunit gamma/tau n=1 Tax=unclassified Microcystis TaxID=2643300 RepID=UPI00258D3A3D|nr:MULTISPECIES: DNA polymerase III subunit gamma/tau [unclassified Microcystis]MCA2667127.1 DNA polymerase III subunit gamma/tau [Microcystis sp. M045S2]MCA2712641.1 DNA polymerase III subunit gamma/tau [Microcystis sp. M172S2]MCA2805868.1 DNA polymerase III subunit gamma/tau [Microcystis sp. M114S2]MCA2834560.1 DNA polymerase III subunit gamma/tau [Microcystis sp. M007S1]MCA2839516.1 DNA polymerase III subunit gamma/tau [Microcystis sp. M078S1]